MTKPDRGNSVRAALQYSTEYGYGVRSNITHAITSTMGNGALYMRMIPPIHASSIFVNKAPSKRLVKKISSFQFIHSQIIMWEQSVE